MEKGNSSRFDGYPCPKREEAKRNINRKRRLFPLWLMANDQEEKERLEEVYQNAGEENTTTI